MRGTTHAVIGVSTCLLLLPPTPNNLLLHISFSLLGSLLPDIDIELGTIKKTKVILFFSLLLIYILSMSNNRKLTVFSIVFFFITVKKLSQYPHRTMTHSLLGLFIASFPIVLMDFDVIPSFIIGYISHLIADSFTKMGVPFLYPFDKSKYGAKLIRTGDFWEYLTLFLSAVLLLKLIASLYNSDDFTNAILHFLYSIQRLINLLSIT